MSLSKTSAWPLALTYVALVVYASLYPFSDWRSQGIAQAEQARVFIECEQTLPARRNRQLFDRFRSRFTARERPTAHRPRQAVQLCTG